MLGLGSVKLAKWIQTKSEERGLVLRNILFALLIGGAQTFISVVPLAIFLTKYDSSLLTYVYMSLGVIIFSVGNIFTFFQKNLSFFQLLIFPLIFFSLSLFVFWGFLMGTDFYWFPMALFIWSAVAYTFLGLVLSNLMLRVFTLQEGKRFFGIVGGSRALGGTITGFLTPLLVKSIGAPYVFLLAPIIILFGVKALFAIKEHHSDRFKEETSVEAAAKEKTSFKKLTNKKYVACLFILAVATTFVYYSLDLLFNTEVKNHFASQAEMTGFLGVFLALSNILTLIGGFFLFGILLDKVGLIVTLFLAPITIGSFIGITLLANFVPSALGLVFGIFSVAILLERMFRQSVYGESLSLLYSPLRPAEREWAQTQYKISIQSISTSSIGVILFFISKTWGIRIPSISFFVLGISGIGIATLVIVKRDYVNMLIGALKKWALVKPEFTKLDKDTLRIIKSHLNSRFPEEVIYALQSIENADLRDFAAVLQQALDSPLLDVRCFALNKIEQHRIQSAKEKVIAICLNEKDPKIVGCALRALGAIADLNQYSWFKERLKDPKMEVAENCLIALFLHGFKAQQKEALDLIAQKARSASEEERFLSAAVMKQVDFPSKGDLLVPLLSDPNMEVRLAACEAAGDVKDERLYSPLIENIISPHLHHAAYKSLLKLAPSDYILKNFARFSMGVQSQLLSLLGIIKGEPVLSFLQKYLTSSDRRLFQAALRSLKNQSFKASNREQISRLLTTENNNILFLQEIIGVFDGYDKLLLHDLLCREIELTQESCFLLLMFIYPEEQICSAMEGLRVVDKNRNSYAIEILLQTLSKEDAKQLVPQLSLNPYANGLQNGGKKSVEDALLKVLNYSRNSYIPAINSAAIFTIGALGLKSLSDVVRKNEAKSDPFIDEISPWALKKLESQGRS